MEVEERKRCDNIKDSSSCTKSMELRDVMNMLAFLHRITWSWDGSGIVVMVFVLGRLILLGMRDHTLSTVQQRCTYDVMLYGVLLGLLLRSLNIS